MSEDPKHLIDHLFQAIRYGKNNLVRYGKPKSLRDRNLDSQSDNILYNTNFYQHFDSYKSIDCNWLQ